jgi:hypothetical protein
MRGRRVSGSACRALVPIAHGIRHRDAIRVSRPISASRRCIAIIERT